MKMLRNMRKFTDTDADISDSKVYKCMEKANEENYKEFKKLYKELSESAFCCNELLNYGIYKLMGYKFDFKPYLRKFLVKYRYDNVYHVVYALNKTNIFDNMYTTRYSIIDIIEDRR